MYRSNTHFIPVNFSFGFLSTDSCLVTEDFYGPWSNDWHHVVLRLSASLSTTVNSSLTFDLHKVYDVHI